MGTEKRITKKKLKRTIGEQRYNKIPFKFVSRFEIVENEQYICIIKKFNWFGKMLTILLLPVSILLYGIIDTIKDLPDNLDFAVQELSINKADL